MQSVKKSTCTCLPAGRAQLDRASDYEGNMFFVYVLLSQKTNRRYTGMSNDPEKRLLQHNGGYTKSTKSYRPWVIVYTESFETLLEARNREKYLKSGIGREYLDKILHL